MGRLTISEALYSYLPDNARIKINTYNNNQPFYNNEEFRNSGDEILNCCVDCFYADNDVIGIQIE